MRRVVLVNRFFHPDHSATSQMASDLAFHLASAGWTVTVITGRLHYENAAQISAPARVGGVRIVRIWSSRFGRKNLIGRAMDYATFYLSAFVAMLQHARRGDVLIAMTDPPLLSVPAAVAVQIRRAHLVNWIQDLFPEVAVALGFKGPAALQRIRDWSLSAAAVNVVICQGMAQRVTRAEVVENWAPASLHPVEHESNPLRTAWKLDGRFVVGYSGNLGRAHHAATIAAAVERLSDSPTQFLFIGSGAGIDSVRATRNRNVTFQPYQPREILSESLSVADVHLVSLDARLEGLILPSKLYGVLAVGRPVIFIGDPRGEVARIVSSTRCGVAVAHGDPEALAREIEYLARNRQLCRDMGQRGRELFSRRFASQHALAAWTNLVERLA